MLTGLFFSDFALSLTDLKLCRQFLSQDQGVMP
jgi:hypothetical protein